MNQTTLTEEKIEAPLIDEPQDSQEPEISKWEALRGGIFLGPAGLIMMSAAVVVDVSEFLVEFIPVAGQVISILIDIGALLFIGGWMYFRSGSITVPSKTGVRTAKVLKWAKRLKWLRPLCVIIEMIPMVSSPLPLWILVVYAELKSGEG